MHADVRKIDDVIAFLRYERGLFDFRAEINCVKGEHGVHNQGVLNLLDNRESDGTHAHTRTRT